MMPDDSPFLEGYVSAIRGTADTCPYADATAQYERWCRGYGRKPPAKLVAKDVTPQKPGCHLSLSADGCRPFVEGYKSAILATRFGRRSVCPYDDGTPEYERWWKGFREPVASKTKPAKKPTPIFEGRRPFVEGYKSAILVVRFGKKDTCPYDEGTSEYERWAMGFRGQIASKVLSERAARC